MESVNFSQLYDYNYSVEVLNALKQKWDSYDFFSCISTPKEKNMLLYLCDCRAEYTLKNGEKVYAESGDVVFAPVNYEYTVKLYRLSKESYTIGVNFLIYNHTGEFFTPDENIRIFKILDSAVDSYFSVLEKESSSALTSPARMKSAVYEILTAISLSLRNEKIMRQKFAVIADGIKYLETDEKQELSIKELAEKCNVSEVYFRRLFTEYSGISPVKYRLESKIEKAKKYLQYDNLTVGEISEKLGFISPAYFAKTFKSLVGKTPSEYRKK